MSYTWSTSDCHDGGELFKQIQWYDSIIRVSHLVLYEKPIRMCQVNTLRLVIATPGLCGQVNRFHDEQ